MQVLPPHLDHRAKPLPAHSQLPLPLPQWQCQVSILLLRKPYLTLPPFLPEEEPNFLFTWFTFYQQLMNGVVVTEPDWVQSWIPLLSSCIISSTLVSLWVSVSLSVKEDKKSVYLLGNPWAVWANWWIQSSENNAPGEHEMHSGWHTCQLWEPWRQDGHSPCYNPSTGVSAEHVLDKWFIRTEMRALKEKNKGQYEHLQRVRLSRNQGAQGPANYGWTVLVNRVYWHTASPLHGWTVCGYFAP